MRWLMVFFALQMVITLDNKISWVVTGVTDEYANLLRWKYYIDESRVGVNIPDVKCARNVPGDSTKIKCIMSVPKIMRGTYKISITSTDPSTGMESEKAPYFITIVDKPPTPAELRKE